MSERRFAVQVRIPSAATTVAAIIAMTNGESPLVSVITIFFNTGRFIAEAIESVLAQDFPDFELILVDDGSIDCSSTVAQNYASRYSGKIVYLAHEGHRNKGMSASRNLGIQYARGTYISFCDADDVWMPNKLSEQLRIFRSNPDLGMVCGAAIYWYSWNGGEDRVVLAGHIQDVSVYPPAASLNVYPLGRTSAPCNDVLVRRDIVVQIGGFENRFTGMYEDQVFLSKIYLVAPVLFSSNVTLKYRQHPDSCCTLSEGTGHYDTARYQFLEWFDDYVRSIERPQSAPVLSAIKRELLAYRRPWLYVMANLPSLPHRLNLPSLPQRLIRYVTAVVRSWIA